MNGLLRSTNLSVGDWVEVRSKQEILRTLDADGRLDGMPFMPEMFAFCGKRFQIYKRAHKTCDTVFPVRGRRVAGAVHLDTRCDGSAHGGCQASCLLFWKDAWLKSVNATSAGSAGASAMGSSAEAISAQTGCTEDALWSSTIVPNQPGAPKSYVCQATRLPYATSDLPWWDVRQYVEDYRSGNVGLGRILAGGIYSLYYNLSQSGLGMGRPMRWLYDKLHRLWGGPQFPRSVGPIPEGSPTPADTLNLQEGELVRVKPHREILKTLNAASRNRGLLWDAEMVPYCGGAYRVLKRVSRILDEKTGVMQDMKNPCIILDKVICQSRYSGCRMFCPRSIYPYWREIWLERLGPPPVAQQPAQEPPVAVDCLPDSGSK